MLSIFKEKTLLLYLTHCYNYFFPTVTPSLSQSLTFYYVILSLHLFLSQFSFYFSSFCVSLNFLWVFLPLFCSPPSPFLPPTVPDSNIKQVGKNGQAIMIYDQCMQQLLTFIMTVVGGRRREGEREWGCVCQSQGCVCVCVCWEDEGWIDRRLGSLVCRFPQIALWWAGAINQKVEHRLEQDGGEEDPPSPSPTSVTKAPTPQTRLPTQLKSSALEVIHFQTFYSESHTLQLTILQDAPWVLGVFVHCKQLLIFNLQRLQISLILYIINCISEYI